eukprot:1744193-Rhodomonas_salina.2
MRKRKGGREDERIERERERERERGHVRGGSEREVSGGWSVRFLLCSWSPCSCLVAAGVTVASQLWFSGCRNSRLWLRLWCSGYMASALCRSRGVTNGWRVSSLSLPQRLDIYGRSHSFGREDKSITAQVCQARASPEMSAACFMRQQCHVCNRNDWSRPCICVCGILAPVHASGGVRVCLSWSWGWNLACTPRNPITPAKSNPRKTTISMQSVPVSRLLSCSIGVMMGCRATQNPFH